MNSSNKAENMYILEQSLQNILLQKQAFQMEFAETTEALKELEKSGEEVFRVIGNLMLKAEKSKIKEELKNKEKMLEIRLRSIERQETSFAEQLEKAREQMLKSVKS